MVVKDTGESSHSYVPGISVDYTWSAKFALDRRRTVRDIVLGKLAGLVNGSADPQWPISGVVLGEGHEADRNTLVLGLGPSRRFGTPSTGRCEGIAVKITEAFGWRRRPENLPQMRIFLGRRMGYEPDSAVYTMRTVRRLVVGRDCGNVALEAADVFSLRYIPGEGVRHHIEPGVVVSSSVDQLERLLHVAADMRQDRLVPEITSIKTQVYSRS